MVNISLSVVLGFNVKREKLKRQKLRRPKKKKRELHLNPKKKKKRRQDTRHMNHDRLRTFVRNYDGVHIGWMRLAKNVKS